MLKGDWSNRWKKEEAGHESPELDFPLVVRAPPLRRADRILFQFTFLTGFANFGKL
jgi:hypothetical protein